MIKIALVGCGGIGMAHLRAYKELKDVMVCAVVDRDIKKAETAAEFSGAKAFTDISQIPSEVDGVSVVTPPQSHFPIASSLLEKNFNVFCEKPLTMDTQEAEKLVDLAEKKKKSRDKLGKTLPQRAGGFFSPPQFAFVAFSFTRFSIETIWICCVPTKP
jgi:predicted dehydrogenase